MIRAFLNARPALTIKSSSWAVSVTLHLLAIFAVLNFPAPASTVEISVEEELIAADNVEVCV